MMNSSLLASTGNSNSCMERYVNRYVVHQQPPPPPPASHHPVHSQHLQAGTSSVAASAASAVAAGYYHPPTNIHPHQHQHHPHNHLQQQQQGQFVTLPTHSHPSQHPNPTVSVPPLAHQTGTAGSHGASSNYMVGCYGTGGSVGASGWTGVPLISTAGNNRRHRKHFAGSGGVMVANNNGNHYPYQHHLPQQQQQQQQQQPQQHYNLSKGTSSGPEFDENANLTRLALHAQGAPLILSNSNRYHHGHHRNHKSSSAATHQTTGSGAGSAKAVTIGSSQIQQESSTNCSTRSSTIQLPQHPGLGCNVGQRRSLDALPSIVGAGGHSGGGVIKSYEAAASLELIPPNGNTNNSPPSTVMSGSTMSSSVSSSSSSTSSTSSTTSSASTETCLPRIIKPRKRRKKDRKPNAGQGTAAGGANGGVVSAGNGTDTGMCTASDSANSGCAAGSLPCLEPHILNVGGASSVHTMNNLLLQHQQSASLHCVPQSMEPLGGGVPNVRDILSELSYIASHNPSVLFPERLTVELAKFLASSSNVSAARYSSVAQQHLPPQQQYSQLHSLLLQLQQHQHQMQQQLEHQQVLHAQQQQLPSQQDQHHQMLMQQQHHHLHQYLTQAQYPQQQPHSQQEQLLPQLSTVLATISNSPSCRSAMSDSGNDALLHPPTAPSGCSFPASERNASFADATYAPTSNPLPSYSTSVSLQEPASPSASSNCSCRLCDPFGRIWAFPMLRHSSCSSADGFESEVRKKNVGVIGSNRSSGGAAFRGMWCTSAESSSFATLNIGENADGCLSRKGSFSDSGSDSGCDLLLSRLPGLCSTEEEEEEDDDEEENDEHVDCVGEESDSLLSSVRNDDAFAGCYRDLSWIGAIVGHPVVGAPAGASSCTRKTKDDELLLMSELTKKLHETLDLVDESSSGHESARSQKEGAGVMVARSGSCSSSSSSTSDNSSGMGSLIGADSSSLSPPSDAFVSFDAMSRSNLFGGKATSIEQRLLMGGDRLFAGGVECLVMDENDVRTGELLKSSATNAYEMVSFKRSLGSSKCEEGLEAGVVNMANGVCANEGGDNVSQESNIVQCEKRNPLSLRPISAVGSLFSVNQQNSAPTGSSSWSSGTGTGGSCLFGGEQQQSQQFLDQHHLPHGQPSTDGGSLGDMLNCFDTFWSGGDHKQLLLTEK